MDDLALWTDGTATVVAGSAEDATAVMVEMDYDPGEVGPWRKEDGPMLTVVHVDDPGSPKDTRTLAEWIAYVGGRGFLASTEY